MTSGWTSTGPSCRGWCRRHIRRRRRATPGHGRRPRWGREDSSAGRDGCVVSAESGVLAGPGWSCWRQWDLRQVRWRLRQWPGMNPQHRRYSRIAESVSDSLEAHPVGVGWQVELGGDVQWLCTCFDDCQGLRSHPQGQQRLSEATAHRVQHEHSMMLCSPLHVVKSPRRAPSELDPRSAGICSDECHVKPFVSGRPSSGCNTTSKIASRPALTGSSRCGDTWPRSVRCFSWAHSPTAVGSEHSGACEHDFHESTEAVTAP